MNGSDLCSRESASRSRRWYVAIALLAFTVSGCSSMGFKSPPRDEELARMENAPTYKVIFATHSGGKPEVFTGHLTRPMTVRDALEESGATDRFGKKMLIDLARAVPEKGTVLKLPVSWDKETEELREDQNYAIHGGDEILVRKDNSNMLGALLNRSDANLIR